MVSQSPHTALRSLVGCVLFLAIGTLPLHAQAARLQFERMAMKDGLSQQPIHVILQDRQGILWLGTTDGLQRYDGYSVKTYRHNFERASISNSDVRSIQEDPDGTLWIGTLGGGLNGFDRVTETFVAYRHDPNDARSLSHDRLSVVFRDTSGALWIGTEGGGLDRFDRRTGTFVHYRHDAAEPASLSHDDVRALAEGPSGDLWIGTAGGLDLFDRRTETLVRYRLPPPPEGRGPSPVNALHAEASGQLWIGTNGGLITLDPASGGFTSFRHDPADPASLSHDRVRAILRDRSGQLWVGTSDGGLNRFEDATRTFRSERHHQADLRSLSADAIMEIFQDRSGLLWIGTAVGLDKLNPLIQAFGHYRPDPEHPRGPSGHRVRAIHEDRSGILWIGTTSGLDGIHRATGRLVHYENGGGSAGLSDDHVSAILEDTSGVLWIGTVYGGLNRLDRATGTFVVYRHDPDDPESLSTDDILFLHEDRAQRLWVGTWDGGLNLFHRGSTRHAQGSFTRFRHDPSDPDSLNDDAVFCAWENPSGRLWLGTRSFGVDEFDPVAETFRYHSFDAPGREGGADDRVHVIHGDADGALWLGTAANGLVRYDPERSSVRIFTTRHGLPSTLVYGILPDREGRLWLSTTNGLSRFDPRSEAFRNYDVTDGLQGNEFNIHSSYRGARGELFFGGNNGFNAFFPEDIRDNSHVPPVVLSAFRIFDREVPHEAFSAGRDGLEIAYRDNMITFEVAALDFSAPEKNRYAYRLEGVHDRWIDLGPKREVTLTNLDPRSYTLHVRGSNNHGVWNEDGILIPFVVVPPWWRTSWFLGSVALGLAALVFAAYRWRTEHMRTTNLRLQKEIDQRKRAEVEREQVITELEAKNTELERFTYTVSHDLKSPLVTIKGFVGLLKKDAAAGDAERMEQDMSRIETAASTMHHLLDELLELSRIGRMMNPFKDVDLGEAVRAVADLLSGTLDERDVELLVASDLPVVFGDPVRIRELLQNLLENAVKFMGDQAAPRVEVGVRQDNGERVCFVRDNGIGIDPRYHDRVFGLFDRLNVEVEGTGVGLTLAQRIMEAHGGRLWVESEGTNRGSTFCFTFPSHVT